MKIFQALATQGDQHTTQGDGSFVFQDEAPLGYKPLKFFHYRGCFKFTENSLCQINNLTKRTGKKPAGKGMWDKVP